MSDETVLRQPVPYPAAPGFRWVPEPGNHWQASAAFSIRRCRFAHFHQKACARPAVAVLDRTFGIGPRRNWWYYCERHLYGGWVENGRVMSWVLRPVEDAAVLGGDGR